MLKQILVAVVDGQAAMVKSPSFVKAFSVVLCLLLLPTIALFVTWLSMMSQPEADLWSLLLAGDVHNILIKPQYWISAWNETNAIQNIDIHMFMHIPALCWACVFTVAMYRLLQFKTPSAQTFVQIAFGFILFPYGFGYFTISILQPAAVIVGPVLAFMMIAPFFMLPVFSGFLFKRF